MTRKRALACMTAGFSMAIALAQGPGPRNMGRMTPDPQRMVQMRVNTLVTLLNLTDAQKATATTIFSDAYTASQSIQANLRDTRQSLSDAVKKNDTDAIDSLAITAGNLSGQLTAIESKAEAAFYATLTPDQQTKYSARPGGGLGGHGGPMGPGGPGPFGMPGRRGE